MDIFELSGVKPVRDSLHQGVMRQLDDSGYSLVVGLGGQSNAISLMQSLGGRWVSVGTLDGQVLDKTNTVFVELRAMFDLAIEGRLSGREAWAEVMC
jgi:hypothetical protein